MRWAAPSARPAAADAIEQLGGAAPSDVRPFHPGQHGEVAHEDALLLGDGQRPEGARPLRGGGGLRAAPRVRRRRRRRRFGH